MPELQLRPCDSCGNTDWARLEFSRNKVECHHCGNVEKIKDITIKAKRSRAGRSARDRTRHSRRSEQKSAQKLGAETTAGSGNRLNPTGKSDFVTKGWLRSEHKETRAQSFSLKLSELEKIEREALATALLPAFHVNFIRSRGQNRTYVVLREDDFVALMNEVRSGTEDDR